MGDDRQPWDDEATEPLPWERGDAEAWQADPNGWRGDVHAAFDDDSGTWEPWRGDAHPPYLADDPALRIWDDLDWGGLTG